jgi:hypothetical protein
MTDQFIFEQPSIKQETEEHNTVLTFLHLNRTPEGANANANANGPSRSRSESSEGEEEITQPKSGDVVFSLWNEEYKNALEPHIKAVAEQRTQGKNHEIKPRVDELMNIFMGKTKEGKLHLTYLICGKWCGLY